MQAVKRCKPTNCCGNKQSLLTSDCRHCLYVTTPGVHLQSLLYQYAATAVFLQIVYYTKCISCAARSTQPVASITARKLSWSICCCFLQLLFACRQKLGSVVGYSKAALLSVSVIQKGLPRRTLLQCCLMANDPHAAPAERNVR